MTNRVLRLRDAALVFAGGTLGTAARTALMLIPNATWQLVGIAIINVTGGFLLGSLTGATEGKPAVRAKLLFGTGALGGFTTYSALAVGAGAEPPLAIASALLGVFAALGGLWVGRRLAR